MLFQHFFWNSLSIFTLNSLWILLVQLLLRYPIIFSLFYTFWTLIWYSRYRPPVYTNFFLKVFCYHNYNLLLYTINIKSWYAYVSRCVCACLWDHSYTYALIIYILSTTNSIFIVYIYACHYNIYTYMHVYCKVYGNRLIHLQFAFNAHLFTNVILLFAAVVVPRSAIINCFCSNYIIYTH